MNIFPNQSYGYFPKMQLHYVNYHNINNNKRRNISIPIVDDDLIYCPNNRFLFKNPFIDQASTNTTEDFDGCIDYLLYFNE